MKSEQPAFQPAFDPSASLKSGERLDDLQRNGARIIQDPDSFCFGMDAVLLAAFAAGYPGARVLDLCSGNGILPILMDARNPEVPMTYTGIELQPEAVDMAQRSARLNDQQERIRFLTGDIREVDGILPPASFDLVTVNPPYIKAGAGLMGGNRSRMIARHEITCTLPEVVHAAAYALRQSGKLFLVHRPHRLAETCVALEAEKLALKRLCLVHPYADREANLVLMEAEKGKSAYVHVQAPLILYDAPGRPTEQLRQIYEGEWRQRNDT